MLVELNLKAHRQRQHWYRHKWHIDLLISILKTEQIIS